MKAIAAAQIRRNLPRTLQKELPRRIKIIRIREQESYALNRRYLGKSYASNVLSFRYDSDYGEILLCPEAIRREADSARNGYRYQLTWMILHGMIHLAGFHHEASHRRAAMVERLERKILQRLFHRI